MPTLPYVFLRDTLILWSPAAMSVIAVLVGLRFFDWWLLKRHLDLSGEKKLPRQLAMLALTGIGIAVVLLAVPLEASTRNQLLAILGLLATATMGLSSTTLVANAMSSVMLRTTDSIRTGDYLRVGEHFGRVTERGLMHTEIQTESRELTTLPNSFLISNPFTVVRSSGTIISATLSLGYDVAVTEVETLLLNAGVQAGLKEPFVRVMELGNFAITYRVSGFLLDVKRLLSAQSDLCKAVIGSLHCAGVEIVSPSFMNQRPLKEGKKFIPKVCDLASESKVDKQPEELMFDKAEEAEQIEIAREKIEAELTELEQRVNEVEDAERKRVLMRIQVRKKQLSEFAVDERAGTNSEGQ